MHGSPQISSQVMVLFVSAQGGAMIQCLSKFFGERSSVKGGVHLGVVIKVNIHVAFSGGTFSICKELRVLRQFSFPPMLDSIRPPIDLRVTVPAHVKLLGAMEPAVHKIRGDVLGVRPFAGGIGNDKRNVVPSKEREKLRHHERRMPDF